MKISEIYESVQGEGPRVGEPTTFIRTGGCNLRCPGWGEGVLPDGSVVQGCDTVFAVYPEWHKSWGAQGIEEILGRVASVPRNVCLTGGEPLIQPREELSYLAEALLAERHTIDLFTNGSQSLQKHWGWVRDPKVSVIMDYKLPGSGEYGSFDITNMKYLTRGKDWIKFVCKDEADFEQACFDAGYHGLDRIGLYFGVVWGGELDPGRLATMLQQLTVVDSPIRLNIQTHKYLWDPDERGR